MQNQIGYSQVFSCSAKAQYDREERGITGGKKVKGVNTLRGRHSGESASCSGTCGQYSRHRAAGEVLQSAKEKWIGLADFSGDVGYHVTEERFVEQTLQMVLPISEKIQDGFDLLILIEKFN